jgi:hypothetical protein
VRSRVEVVPAPRLTADAVARLIAPRPVTSPLLVGVLTGSSGSHFADGVRDGLVGVVTDVREVTVEAPHRGAAVDAARMLEAGVRVIVTDLPSRVLHHLAPLCRRYDAALVAVGTGSLEVPDPLDGVVHVTEQRWDAAFELGDWAARHLDGRLFQVVAAPDAEYDVVDALARGHRGAGGEVVGSATTHDGATASGVEDAAMAALMSGAGTVAVHATARAAEIVRAVRRTCGDVAIVLDGPDDRAVGELSRRFGAVYSATSAGSRSTAADAGRLVAAGAALLDPHSPVRWTDLTDVLAGVTVEGIGGPVVLDPLTHSTRSQVVVRRTSTGRPTVVARRAD